MFSRIPCIRVARIHTVLEYTSRHRSPTLTLAYSARRLACALNAGVWLVRVSEWVRSLWRDVWAADASRRFWQRPHHEQSCLLHQLALRGQPLKQACPFHSFAGGQLLKLSQRVAVLPRHAFNTNRGDVRPHGPHRAAPALGAAREAWPPWRGQPLPALPPAGELVQAGGRGTAGAADARCEFVFHAAGRPAVLGAAPGKLEALRAMLTHAGLGGFLRHGAAGAGEAPAAADGEESRLFGSLALLDSLIVATRNGALLSAAACPPGAGRLGRPRTKKCEAG